MHKMKTALVLGILAVGLMACADNNNTQNGNGRELGPSGYKVNFELKNDSGQEILAYRSVEKLTPCAHAPYVWLSIERDGEVVRPGENNTFCTCAEQENTGHCSAATPACAAPAPSNVALPSGEARQFQWDGRVWEPSKDSTCVSAELVDGETLKATICYGNEFANDGNSNIADPICESVEFSLDQPEQTVRIVAPAP